MSEKMTIGRLAEAAGVNVETVRFYQRRGLIDEPQRPGGGYRTYRAIDVGRLRFIRRAQTLGFTLDEIANLLKLQGSRQCVDTRDVAQRKLAMIEAKLADLLAMKTALDDLVLRCGDGQGEGSCPIIEALIADRGDGVPSAAAAT